MRLRSQLLIWFFVLSAIPIAIYIFFLVNYSLEEFRTKEIDNLSIDNEKAYFQLASLIDKYRDEASAITGLPPISGLYRTSGGVIDYFDGSTEESWLSRLQQIFRSFVDSDKNIDSIRYLNTDGVEVVRVDRRKNGEIFTVANEDLQNKSHRGYYIEGIKKRNGEVYVSELDLNIENGEIEIPYKPVIRFASPTYVDGKLTGLIILNINLNSFLNILELDDKLTLLDSEGYFIIDSESTNRFTKQLNPDINLFKEEVYKKGIDNSNSSGHFIDESSKKYVYWSKIDLEEEFSNSIYVVSRAGESDILSPITNLVKTMYVVGSAVMIVALLIAYIISIRITNPIEVLTEKAKKYREGEFSKTQESEISGSKEVEDLDSAVTSMAKELIAAQSSLQSKVTSQTKEIEENLEDMKDKNFELENIKKAMMNLLEDIESEKERSEEQKNRLNAILSSMTEGLVAFNQNQRVVLMNQKASTMLRVAPKAAEGMMIHDLLKLMQKGKKVKDEDSPVTKSLSHGVVLTRVVDDYEVVDSNGNRIPVIISAASLSGKDDVGNVKGIVMIKDVTLDKQVDKAKTEFVSLASHQLRTPLSSISWYAEMLLAGDVGKLEKDQEDYVRQVYEANQRMVSLVNALLDVSRLELGTFSIEPKEASIVDVVKGVVKDVSVQINERKQNITESYDESIKNIPLDIELTKIVVLNLLTNAIKYTGVGGNIDVSVKSKGREIELTVKDNGYGIPDSQQSKIFSKLFRADNVQSLDTEGTGLGLYIVKSILDQVGGRIEFTSQEKVGTTFSVYIPSTGMRKKIGEKRLGT